MITSTFFHPGSDVLLVMDYQSLLLDSHISPVSAKPALTIADKEMSTARQRFGMDHKMMIASVFYATPDEVSHRIPVSLVSPQHADIEPAHVLTAHQNGGFE